MTVSDGGVRRSAIDLSFDINLPDGSGLDVLASVRHRSVRIPVLIVSGADEIDATVTALDAGADDYLHKPYRPNELRARVRALMRRAHAAEPGLLVCGNLVVNRIERTVVVAKDLSSPQRIAFETYVTQDGISRSFDKVWRST